MSDAPIGTSTNGAVTVVDVPPAAVIMLKLLTDIELVPLVMAAGLETVICIGLKGKLCVIMQRPFEKGALAVDRQPVVLLPPLGGMVIVPAEPQVMTSPKFRGWGHAMDCAMAGDAKLITVKAESRMTALLNLPFLFWGAVSALSLLLINDCVMLTMYRYILTFNDIGHYASSGS